MLQQKRTLSHYHLHMSYLKQWQGVRHIHLWMDILGIIKFYNYEGQI